MENRIMFSKKTDICFRLNLKLRKHKYVSLGTVFHSALRKQEYVSLPHKSQKWIYKIKTLLIEQFVVSNLTFNVSQIRLMDLGVMLNVIYIIP